MTAAEEVDNHGAGSGFLEHSLASNIEGDQQAQAWTWIGLKQEVDRTTRGLGGRHTERRENAVVDGIVEEQDLGRFDEDRSQRQQAGSDQPVDQRTSRIAEC